ncbi:WD repeat domain-containing protein [Pleurostoma richardsiae]|uniref:WD repeat domain-containing protein n=1 Tax=Pleurostoma richardsiae TaxID=41990 RepID=A0AA38RR32_9PEZI|nr:WD repeat domain-containing protein [Pleurostoma richardsiae]
MDRPDPGLVRWSPNPAHDSFLHINVQHRVVQLFEPTGRAQRGKFDYKRVSKHDDVPPLTAIDWSPSIPGLVAAGTSTGIVNLLRVDDNSNAYMELGLKVSRTCQAVSFSTSGLLAVGLDRVRSDQCLHIWDVNRLSSGISTSVSGFGPHVEPFTDPVRRLEASMSISSVKFFEDNPNTLVVGIRGQGLRIHDLREEASSYNFPTRCNNNLAIDYADPNYFASSALDQPGIMIWDRRARSRPVASASYLDAVDTDELPWGGALRLDRAMETESNPQALNDRNSLIRALRYCRDHRGMLAVLSRTGQLKVFSTQTEFTPAEMDAVESPELLQVRKSHEMDNFYADPSRKHERIVSFDWLTMESPALRPRLLVLRASGAFDILEIPSFTRTYPYKLTPWQAPYRGLMEGSRYHSLMEFEPSQIAQTLGPLFMEDALDDIPIFGENKADVETLVQGALRARLPDEDIVVDREASTTPLPKSFHEAGSVAEKLRVLRKYANEVLHPPVEELLSEKSSVSGKEKTQPPTGPPSNRELHEKLLKSVMDTKGFPKAAQVILDHVMLLRAKERYLFDMERNHIVLADDPWLRDVWSWIGGAEEAASDGGMITHPLDLSFMGVHTVWTNELGERPSTRLSDISATTETPAWERCANTISKRRGLPKFDGTETKKPHHRQLCLEMCNWGRTQDRNVYNEEEDITGAEKPSTWYTMMTAHALFRGDSKQAVQILKKASTAHPQLLFVSLALQLIGKGDHEFAPEQLDFDEAVASKTDPYLRAISSLIATGDWAALAGQRSLPLRDRVFIAVRHFDDDHLTRWLTEEVEEAVDTGDIEGIVLTGITERMVDILSKYVEKFHDFQTATLIMSICAPRYIDDYRCTGWRNAYRSYLQRHKAFFQRTKFEVESTKKSKRDGRPTVKVPYRQINLRCVYCDAETTLNPPSGPGGGSASTIPGPFGDRGGNPLTSKMSATGISCPNCKRHLPRCVVCLEIVGLPRSDKPEAAADSETRLAARFPTFCLKCEHVLHLDHARQWFARHVECPVPECRCRCNFRANPELNYH